MKRSNALSVVVAAVLGAGLATGAVANSDCGMNTNKPCPDAKLGSKEPAYSDMNKNKPQEAKKAAADPSKVKAAAPPEKARAASAAPPEKAKAASAAPPEKAKAASAAPPEKAKAASAAPPEKAAVKAAGAEQAPAKASLTGVKGSDLKVQPQDPKTQQKEPAK